MPTDAELPAALEQSLEGLEVLDEGALRRTANHAFDLGLAQELERLNLKLQRGDLTEPERERQIWLLGQYEREMLMRARAAVLLTALGGTSPKGSSSNNKRYSGTAELLQRPAAPRQ